jgi:predicted acyltransferase
VKASGGLTWLVGRRIIGRTLRLFGVGLVLANLDWVFDPAQNTWAIWHVLQRIALVYAAASLLFLTFRPRTLALIAGAVLVLYWPLTLLPSLDETPTNLWQRGHTFVSSVDRLMLGDHRVVKGPEGYDPEGLLSTLPAIAQALLGVFLGLEFLERRGRQLAERLAVAGALMVAVGLAWGHLLPVVKDLWSSSFVLLTTGVTVLALAALHLWLDDRPPLTGLLAALVGVPTSFGLNAIAAYVLYELTDGILSWAVMVGFIRRAAPVLSEPVAALFPAALVIFFSWLAVDALRRRGKVLTI